MSFIRIASAAIFGACLFGSAAAAAWRPVPGAPELEVALGSMQLEGTLVVVWLRSPGHHPLAPEWGSPAGAPARIHRTALRAEFDCSHRTVRILAANAYDAAGAAVAMVSTPGTARAVAGGDLGWTYDAVCEAARAGRRL